MKTKLCFPRKMWVLSLALAMVVFISAASAYAEPWKFGVMSDTQWKYIDDVDNNPGTVAVGIINQLNQEFISHDVKFVLQVGDLDDKETNYSGLPADPRLGVSTRAAAAQALYDAGIGFFPVRGNHEASSTAALEVQTYFPQTRTGTFTNTDGVTFTMGTNFSSPFPTLSGLSYSFDFNNARFVLLDQFTRTDNTNYLGSSNNNIIDQQPWISSTLSSKSSDSHAFVFSHKQLFGGNHTDTLFNKASLNPDAQNAFIGSLHANNVGYIFTGHDHMHNLSIVTSPDYLSQVHQVICASDSYKFYTPVSLANHGTDTVGPNAGQISKNREMEISQELWSVGYYIVTVDGPRVTVEFYSADPNPSTPGLEDLDLLTTPALTFSKRETFGYSLNGKEFLVPQGKSYTSIEDSFGDTTARILNGINGSTGTDYNLRPLTKAINTGWAPRESNTASDILTLWGMEDSLITDSTNFVPRTKQTDTYTLSMTYNDERVNGNGNGGFWLATKDAQGKWVKAVNMNFGGKKNFVKGPWVEGYELGTYGIDPDTKTAWAVINYNGDFAVNLDVK